MSKKTLILKPIAAVAGVAFVSSMVVSGTALAADNPFEAADLDSGYLLAGDDHDGEEGDPATGDVRVPKTVDGELHEPGTRDLERVREHDADHPDRHPRAVGAEVRKHRPEFVHGEVYPGRGGAIRDGAVYDEA